MIVWALWLVLVGHHFYLESYDSQAECETVKATIIRDMKKEKMNIRLIRLECRPWDETKDGEEAKLG